MNGALVSYNSDEFEVMQRMAKAMVASGFFSDTKDVAQALVKIQAGREMGLPAFASMSGIHIIQSKPVLGANLIATLVKNDPRYDYRIRTCDNNQCVLVWYESGKPVGESGFTIAEAQTAGLAGKDNWKKYPSDMLFARAISRGARRYAPGIFGGAPVYTPDEFNLDTDAEGQIINVTPAPVIPIGARVQTNAAKPDDEQVIYETTGHEFIPVAAELLNTDETTIKEQLKALGYSGIPRNPNERVKVWHALKSAASEQDDLFGEITSAVVVNGAYEE